MGKLEGKIAIVTGSGKGIGRDAALATELHMQITCTEQYHV